jgi:hypothetical protein
VLERAGQPVQLIGVLVSVGNGANIAGAALVARVRSRTLVRAVIACMLAAGIGAALVGLVAGLLSFLALTPAMLIAGLLITLPVLTTRRLTAHTARPVGPTAQEGGAP